MSSSTNKRVIVLRLEREPLTGFVHPQTFQTSAGIEMLNREGNVLTVPYSDVKVLCFVQDFDDELPDLSNKTFASRPKSNGLWLRLEFRDGTYMDGMLPNSLLDLEPYGFTLTPPALKINPQRVFVPKAALRSIQVVAVVGGGLAGGRKKKVDERQISIFG